jgi:hypothetical protein
LNAFQKLRASPDALVVLGVSAFFLLCSALYLPGLPAGIAAASFDNPVFYADRFALPQLYPDDVGASYQRELYPFFSLVHAVPSLLWKYAHVPPIYPTAAMVVLNDLLIVLATYWLSRALSFDRAVSLAAALFAVTSRLLSWNLAGYAYLGHDYGYAGSFVIPFAVAVIPSLMQRRVAAALCLTAIAVLIYPPWGAVSLAVIGGYLIVRGERSLWLQAARWAMFPILALAAVLAVQAIAGAGIERMSPEQARKVVMGNGHFVPLWTQGQPLASPYLGFFMWCLLAALAWPQWRLTEPLRKEPIVVLVVVVLVSFAAWVVAYELEWFFVLRTSLFRNSTLLAMAWLPFVTAYLVQRMRDADPSRAMAAGLVMVVLLVDRSTAWVLPIVVPAILFLAFQELRRTRAASGTPRAVGVVGAIAVAALVAIALDIVFGVGVVARAFQWLDASGRIAGLFREASARMRQARVEVALLLAIVAIAGATVMRQSPERRGRHAGVAVVLCAFMLACIGIRSAARGIWWATGDPSKLAQAELWAKQWTPVSAKFIFFELDAGGYQMSWHTLAQRGTAELQYTTMKQYSSDRRLLAIDRYVSDLYALDGESAKDAPSSYDRFQLYERYQRFGLDDFMRVARLSRSNFVVLKQPRSLDLPVAYRNDLFTIYRIPGSLEGASVVLRRVDARAVKIAWSAPRLDTPTPLVVEFRDATSGVVRATHCCVTIATAGTGSTTVTPQLPPGTFLPTIRTRDGRESVSWDYLEVE